jgi:hypothetical protein
MTNSEALTPVFQYFNYRDDEWPSKPWRLGEWLWATQRHFIVAVRDDGSDAEPTPEKMAMATHYLYDVPTVLGTTTRAALQAFAGAVVSTDVKCERCGGSGRDDGGELLKCEHCGETTRQECGECGGDGKGFLPIASGLIVKIPLNRHLLAFALSRVPVCDVVTVGTLVVGKERKWSALVFLGETWRIVLMGIREPQGETMVFDALEPATSTNAVDPVDRIVTG